MSGKIRILVASDYLGYPALTGGVKRIMNPILKIAEGGRHAFSFLYNFETVNSDTKKQWLDDLLESLAGVELARSVPRYVRRYYEKSVEQQYDQRTEHFKDALSDLLRNNRYDIVQIEHSQMGWIIPYVRAHSPHSKILFDLHNVEYLMWQRRYEAAADEQEKRNSLTIWQETERLEKTYWPQADRLMTVSVEEADIVRKHCPGLPVDILPTGGGIDTSRYAWQQDVSPRQDIVWIGSVDWYPNAHGLEWFLDHVFPQVLDKAPNAVFHIAGFGEPSPPFADRLRSLAGHVKFWGTVEDERPLIRSGRAFVVPLWIGAGARVKIITAWACGVPVVATTIGAEGLRADNGRNICVSDDAGQMAKAIIRLLQDDDFHKRLSVEGRQTAVESYSLDRAAEQQRRIYDELAGCERGEAR